MIEHRAQDRYGPIAQAFHWLTAALVLAAYLLSEGGPESRVYSQAVDVGRRLHETLGIAVFVVVLLRLLWRSIDWRPEPQPVAAWMLLAAKIVQFLLYALLIAIPVTAILGTWFEGHKLTFIGLDIASPWPESHGVGAAVIDIHTTLGNLILWIAGLHAAAALFHHWYLRDGVLTSMLPRWK